ncbi:TPA: DUF4810 domain-containing protein [Neisseria meningitidis]|uniref:Lipoprotein n=2 Tax=Neisseria meningitidis TaxID=487 RepID=C6SED3_NEIME|nr:MULTISPECIES: DUF4810 domain-containing protein [Neisseria]EOC23497.1 putative lipoprotein [Neisseria meningitidis NM3147]CBA08012.1 hypothetical protein NME_1652 [Neisseria meningitidis alpha153]ADZ01504.1 putative lipoprotein [Neisseria meningitidis M04-240196]AIZ17182.1 lipoprotein [Neisseria meningitidis]AIZ27205.1 lipoprotein [Neisseria meningitidis]
MNPKTLSRLSLCAAVLALTACGDNGQKSLYYYGGYPDTVYEGLKNDDTSLGKQTEKMEKYFVEAGNKKMNAAPGAHAHLGLLLSRSGDKEGAFRQFEEEKRLFPESGVFMDFLMKTGKGGKR